MAPALKFLHAADLHLDRVLEGLPEIPSHLKATLSNAAYQAAENLFDLALTERVDLLLLAGDIVDLDQGGPRAATFLQSQFQRLADKQIPVVWCSGAVDQLDRWPAAASLPPNVSLCSSSMFERQVVAKQGKALATVFAAGHYPGRQALHDLSVSVDDPFPIALCYNPAGELPEALPIRYWALGGDHSSRIVERGSTSIVQPGTPQARAPHEAGRRTVVLGQVDSQGKLKIEPTAVDVVRWQPQTVAFAESASDEEIRGLLADRALHVLGDLPEQLGLVEWSFETTGNVAPRLRTAAWRTELLRWLRAEFGAGAKGMWSVDIRWSSERPLPRNWYEEDTMLGDYLQTLGRYQADPELPLPLHAYLPTALGDERLAALARLAPERRSAILHRAAWVGIERLGVGSAGAET